MSDSALSEIASALRALGNGNASTQMGALEAHGLTVTGLSTSVGDGLTAIAKSIDGLALSVEALAYAVTP